MHSGGPAVGSAAADDVAESIVVQVADGNVGTGAKPLFKDEEIVEEVGGLHAGEDGRPS